MASEKLTARYDPYQEMENYLEKVAEELDEVFNQLSKKSAESPGKLETNWPPNSSCNDANKDNRYSTENGDYLTNNLGGRFDDVILELQLPERIVCQACAEGIEKVYFGDNCSSGIFPNNMRYRLSSTKRKRCHSRSLDQSSLQLPDCYEDKSALLLKVKVLNTTPPTPVRRSSLNRFQTIIAHQQKQLERQDSDGGPHLEVATQTSPTCSRSSSFTWLSDRSDTGNCSSTEEAVTPCSSTDDSVTDHHISCGSSTESSVTPPGRSDEPESGIGTASPPHHRYSKSGNQKCRRKETWERLQRRHADRRVTIKHTEPPVWSTPAVEISDQFYRPATRPNRLPLTSESEFPVKNVSYELPSPTAVSLDGGGGEVNSELGGACKSSSAPHLIKSTQTLPCRTKYTGESKKWKHPKCHSEQYLEEIEAKEACKWLRAAGFPQYAQMYEDLQFPIDVNGVQKDHPFLDLDSLQSLFRRLHALNRCANMKLDFVPKHAGDDSDSEGECALSENWTFQRESRRWSRVDDIVNTAMMLQQQLQSSSPVEHHHPGNQQQENHDLQPSQPSCGGNFGNNTMSQPPLQSAEQLQTAAVAVDASDAALISRFRRSGSERIRDGAKAILRRVESLKTRRRKQRNRDGVIIGSPQIIDMASMQQRMKELNCVDVTPPDSPVTDDHIKSKRFLAKPESLDSLAYSDSELSWRNDYTDANSNNTKPLLDFMAFDGSNDFSSPNGSQDSRTYKTKYNDSVDSVSSAMQDSDQELTTKSKGSVVRWHSFQKTKHQPNALAGQMVGSLTVGQLLVLRKFALLKLTAIMERYCPTHRTGWNWELPKFMRKTKMPDPKDKTVFGAPLIANVQKYGSSLPPFVPSAFRWLEDNALDHVGLFRKPGVKSRIQRLKQLAEAEPNDVKFENHQAYDVADMVKQYFRELPEALLTNKLSESFIAIFQHVPVYLQKEAVHYTVLLLPDEHREALFALLDFLCHVSSKSNVNQMSASNLAVCLAPSLFHLGNSGAWSSSHPHGGSAGGSTPSSPVTSHNRSSSVSPRRNHHQSSANSTIAVGLPDSKQLGQNKAAHDCLLFLIKHYRQLFAMSEDVMSQCHFSYMDESIPISLEELGAEMGHDWRGYLNACTSALLKEAKEKNRGWVAVGSFENVDISYKKVGDGHPLRLWRVCTEVEAPPAEVLARILWERHVWDANLVSARVVAKMDARADLYQYADSAMSPHPAKDFCVARSWRTDLNRGGCAVVETSVEHPDAKQPAAGAVRGIVLASRYLIEPCGSGRSRVLHLSRVDTKGRTCEWYNKIFGHITSKYLSAIRKSFEHSADGPESKV
ncbi:rho GTPase-activating protein 7 isoform X2 [Melanaphis sacchari]|uniref:rho GTPase-activating protein 7 isoform X2 n=1 Tax=Melanaphis sacchari TaxID=742174 RepID=UPI000DC13846|nr:rho GTPase-activating protein 7 isoform X2 [Melanaphis sacchari]